MLPSGALRYFNTPFITEGDFPAGPGRRALAAQDWDAPVSVTMRPRIKCVPARPVEPTALVLQTSSVPGSPTPRPTFQRLCLVFSVKLPLPCEDQGWCVGGRGLHSARSRVGVASGVRGHGADPAPQPGAVPSSWALCRAPTTRLCIKYLLGGGTWEGGLCLLW